MRTLYFAAGLFNGSDKTFNVFLNNELERRGNRTFLPQRDGFEFGRLENELKNFLSSEIVPFAVNDIIWTLDIGKFVTESDFTLAKCDEPLDPGVDVEMCAAHFLGKGVIGYRTDVRSPYGSLETPSRGIHPFSEMMSDVFISHFDNLVRQEQINPYFSNLADKIIGGIKKLENQEGRWNPSNKKCIMEIEDVAKYLFSGIEIINSPEGTLEVVKRYSEKVEHIRKTYGPIFIA